MNKMTLQLTRCYYSITVHQYNPSTMKNMIHHTVSVNIPDLAF